MKHAIHFVQNITLMPPYTLSFRFEDGTEQTINFEPVLHGELYGPLRDQNLFSQVKIDPEVRTLVWPNGADFDPATLYDWPLLESALIAQAKKWN